MNLSGNMYTPNLNSTYLYVWVIPQSRDLRPKRELAYIREKSPLKYEGGPQQTVRTPTQVGKERAAR